jgi:CubicO group peptidase (beta-lactamase class C family)
MLIKSLCSINYLALALVLLLSTATLCPAAALSQPRHFPSGTHEVYIAKTDGVRSDLLKNIAPIIEKSISNGKYPGAVVLIGHKGKIIYRGTFGNRRIIPNVAPMRFDTIFDIASLTKVVVTTPAIMQLVEQGKLDIDAPVAAYWPDFAKHGKYSVTIRELLTHTSGLPAEIPDQEAISNEDDALVRISRMRLAHAPGTKFLYSDVNFVVLAHLVEMVSNQRIDVYAQDHIFKPLKMETTFYTPAIKFRDRIAPTEIIDKKLRWGVVHDPLAYSLGGIAGNAGVFSTAADLGAYAQSLLNGGLLPQPSPKLQAQRNHFLGPLAVSKMTTPQTPDNLADTRGFGWDIDSRYSNRGILFPIQSYGHTGFTGTSLWIDPVTKTWIVILTSRTHPTPTKGNQLIQDRRTIANIVSASIIDITNLSLNNTGKGELIRAFPQYN